VGKNAHYVRFHRLPWKHGRGWAAPTHRLTHHCQRAGPPRTHRRRGRPEYIVFACLPCPTDPAQPPSTDETLLRSCTWIRHTTRADCAARHLRHGRQLSVEIRHL